MTRDEDYIREMLLEIESHQDSLYPILDVLDRDDKKYHHAQLLCDGGFLLRESKHMYRLTSKGHDYIAAIRDPKIWDKIKKKTAELFSVVTTSSLSEVAKEVAKEVFIR